MKKISYFIILMGCLWYSWLNYMLLVSLVSEGSHDLAIYVEQLHRWAHLDFTSANSIRGTWALLDHQAFSMILLTPLGFLGLPGLLIATPIMAILLPIYLIDKGLQKRDMHLSALHILLFGIFMLMNPYMQNAMLFGGFRSSVWAGLTVAMLFYAWMDGRKRLYIPAFLISIMAKEDMVLYSSLVVLQLALFDWISTKQFKKTFLKGLPLALISFMYAGFLMWFGQFRTVEYDMTFSWEMTDAKEHEILYYWITEIPSWFLGNFAGIAGVIIRYGSDYITSPIFHHGLLSPLFVVISFSLLVGFLSKRNTQ